MSQLFPIDFSLPTIDFICADPEESSFNYTHVRPGSLRNVKSSDVAHDLGG